MLPGPDDVARNRVLLRAPTREAPAALGHHELLPAVAPAEREDLAGLLDAELRESAATSVKRAIRGVIAARRATVAIPVSNGNGRSRIGAGMC